MGDQRWEGAVNRVGGIYPTRQTCLTVVNNVRTRSDTVVRKEGNTENKTEKSYRIHAMPDL